MSGGVPANTTTTTTVNQSPWQNPTYQALMLGTKDKPGPLTNILRSNEGYMNAYNNLLGKGITPMDVAGSAQFNPTVGVPGESFRDTQTAADGGIMNARGFADGGLTKQEQQWLKTKQKQIDAGTLTGKNKEYAQTLQNKQQTYQQQQDTTKRAQESLLQQAMGQVAFVQRNPQTGQLESTNPLFNQAVARVQDAQQMPSQFGQATDAYNQAISGLQGLTNYTPQQVEAAKIARGDIRDVAAQQAQVERMQGGPNVEAILSEAARMEGPGSWTEPGVAQKYMSPYMQNVVDIQKREANRDYQKQMAQLSGQAAGMGAFGGTRAALERAEMRRNQKQKLADIQAMGQQQAYQSGMGQYGAESQLGQAARQSNLQAAMQSILANQQAGMTAQQLNQMYGQGGFQAQAANQQAQNTAYNNYVQQQLTAAGMNQGMDWNTANQNAQMQMQAALANQQAGLQANQQNIGAYGQMMQGAQGLGSLGAQQAQTNLANIGALGQAASAWQNLGQQYFTNQQQNALNTINFPSSLYGPALNAINAQPSTAGSNVQTGTTKPASWMGAEGGEVEAHKAWDKAKGGKSDKKGIASKGWS